MDIIHYNCIKYLSDSQLRYYRYWVYQLCYRIHQNKKVNSKIFEYHIIHFMEYINILNQECSSRNFMSKHIDLNKLLNTKKFSKNTLGLDVCKYISKDNKKFYTVNNLFENWHTKEYELKSLEIIKNM